MVIDSLAMIIKKSYIKVKKCHLGMMLWLTLLAYLYCSTSNITVDYCFKIVQLQLIMRLKPNAIIKLTLIQGTQTGGEGRLGTNDLLVLTKTS
jgi:hypothetical protein